VTAKNSGLSGNAFLEFHGGGGIPTFNDYQKLMLTILAMDILAWEWMLPLTYPPPDRFMTTLVLAVYSCDLSGKPLNKRAAWRQIGCEDIKTARKYIAKAQEKKWIKVVQSPVDRRNELLVPTEKLKWHVAHDLHHFGLQVCTRINALLQFALPNSSETLGLHRTKRDLSPERIIEAHLKYVDEQANESLEEREKSRKRAAKEMKQFRTKWRAARVSGGS